MTSGSAPETGDLGPGAQPDWATPALLDDLRVRMERVRARLTALVDDPPAGDGAANPGTVAVPADLLRELGESLVVARALIGEAAAALREEDAPASRRAPLPAGRETACMVALNMALNGASRAETERYFAVHFALPDAGEIIADAYAYRERMRAESVTRSR